MSIIEGNDNAWADSDSTAALREWIAAHERGTQVAIGYWAERHAPAPAASEDPASLIRDLWKWMVRTNPLISAALVVTLDAGDGTGLNLLAEVPALRERVERYLMIAK